MGDDLADVQALLRKVRTFVEEWQYALGAAGDRASVRIAVEQLSFEVEYLGAQADFKARRLHDIVVALADRIGAGTPADDGSDAELPEDFEPIRTGRTDVFDIDTAIAQVAGQCATAGGLQHRLEFVVNRLAGPEGDLVGAEREIRDAIPAQVHAWSADYRAAYPSRAESARFLTTRAGPAAAEVATTVHHRPA